MKHELFLMIMKKTVDDLRNYYSKLNIMILLNDNHFDLFELILSWSLHEILKKEKFLRNLIVYVHIYMFLSMMVLFQKLLIETS